MTTLADISFDALQAGMKFKHPQHGEQIILELGRGQLGLVIRFHDSPMYDGALPRMGEEEYETDIFQLIAQKTYPYGARDWEYVGMVSAEETAAHDWQWFRVACPHCGTMHRLLATSPAARSRCCIGCGMVFYRPLELL